MNHFSISIQLRNAVTDQSNYFTIGLRWSTVIIWNICKVVVIIVAFRVNKWLTYYITWNVKGFWGIAPPIQWRGLMRYWKMQSFSDCILLSVDVVIVFSSSYIHWIAFKSSILNWYLNKHWTEKAVHVLFTNFRWYISFDFF